MNVIDNLFSDAHPQCFTKGRGGADPEAKYKLCLI